MKFQDGERYPCLVSTSGLPHFEATLFATSQVRGSGAKPNTIYAVLSAIRCLVDWLDEAKINLEERFRKGRCLTRREIDSLDSFIRELRVQSSTKPTSKVAPIRASRRLEDARATASGKSLSVQSSTRYIRLTYIVAYLTWLASSVIEREGYDDAARQRIRDAIGAIEAKRPSKARRSGLSAKRGLEDDAQEALLELVATDSPRNPFANRVRARNQLLIELLYALGLRAGELLALKVADFDLVKNEVVIARRHDDAEDPRPNQPVVKTSDRRLPLSQELADLVLGYVTKDRRSMPNARRHPFLFVVHQPGPHLGEPLGFKGLSKLFEVLRRADHRLFNKLSCHSLRHTVNDRFSEAMDRDGVAPATEEKLRSNSMGWKEGSGSAATYTRRHTERKAREAFLKLQQRKPKESRNG